MGIKTVPEVGELWSHHHIQILKQWKAKAFVQLWLHDNSIYYYMFINNWMSYPIILISTVCSAVVLINDSVIMRIIIGAFSFVNAILTAVNRQLCPGSIMQEHFVMSKRYNNLIRNVDTCLCLTEAMRPHPSVFIERVGMEIDNLANNTLTPPGYVVKKFEKIFGTLDRMLYGEHVFELLKLEMQTRKMVNNVRRKSEMIQNTPGQNEDVESAFEASLENEMIDHKKLYILTDLADKDLRQETHSGFSPTSKSNPRSSLEYEQRRSLGDNPIRIYSSIDNVNIWSLKNQSVDGNPDVTPNANLPVVKSPMRSPFFELKSLMRAETAVSGPLYNESKN